MTFREPPAEEYVCAKCRVALDWHTVDGWVHPLVQIKYVDGVQGHMPEPVPATSVLEHRYVCDFCFAPDPRWTYPCASFMFEDVDGGTGYDYEGSNGDWAACDDCRPAIERGDRNKLVARWKKASPTLARAGRLSASEQADVELAVHGLMRQFFAHRTGPGYRE